jgi:hypothetical protein
MKSIQIKIALLLVTMSAFMTSCTKDSDAQVNVPATTLFADNFDDSDIANADKGWSTIAEVGTKNWAQGIYSGNGYATFSSYQSGEPVNVAWLISKSFNMDAQSGEKLFFQTCTDGHVKNMDNSVELYVSADYDGTNFTTASWQKVPAIFAGPDSTKYQYVNSGIIDLSSYKGTIHFAFKMRGTTSLTGGYQIDNVRLFY